MKVFVLCLLLAVGPLVAIGSELASNTTEKAAVKSETNLDQSPVQHSPTTDSSTLNTKDNQLHQSDKKADSKAEPFLKKSDAPFLHRIPVYQNRNPLVETITNLNSKAKEADPTPKVNSTSESTTTELELPIPSRCPHITGTAEEDRRNKDDLFPLLGVSSKPAAAQRGCRFFIMNELMDRSSTAFIHATPEEQLNRTLHSCFKSCTQAYDNGTDVCEACFDGCRKTAKVTEVVKKTLTDHDEDGLEREDESGHGDAHRTFSIIIPLRPIESEDDESKDSTGNQGSDAFPSMMPNAINAMLQMMRQMSERARLAMANRGQGDNSIDNGNGNIQESETSIDGSGNSISVSRSMSVLMTKDKDGHSKMLVVHTLPKIQIHRFGQNQFGTEEDNNKDFSHKLHELLDGKESSNHETTEDDDDDAWDDGDDFRVKLFGHLSNGHHRNGGGDAHQTKDEHNLKDEESNTQVYFYRTRLCHYLPRLFYITLIILVLYVVFWLFCAVPTALYGRTIRRGSSESGMAIISNANTDGKRKKFFFTNNARYFALNNKRNSTTSLPPPYPEAENGESCAEPLPEKKPLPEGGIDIKLSGDK